MAGAADQNLANGGGGVPLGAGLPPPGLAWKKGALKMALCAVHLVSDNDQWDHDVSGVF